MYTQDLLICTKQCNINAIFAHDLHSQKCITFVKHDFLRSHFGSSRFQAWPRSAAAVLRELNATAQRVFAVLESGLEETVANEMWSALVKCFQSADQRFFAPQFVASAKMLACITLEPVAELNAPRQ